MAHSHCTGPGLGNEELNIMLCFAHHTQGQETIVTDPLPDQKQTVAAIETVGTHPTGMHTCFLQLP